MALIEGTGTIPDEGEIAQGALAGLRTLLDGASPAPDRGGAEGARVGAEVGTRAWDLPSPSGSDVG